MAFWKDLEIVFLLTPDKVPFSSLHQIAHSMW